MLVNANGYFITTAPSSIFKTIVLGTLLLENV